MLSDRDLLAMASEASAWAHAPYSGFQVGAALLCSLEDGSEQCVLGANYETAHYRAVCAERHALQSARVTLKSLNLRFLKLAIFSPQKPVGLTPCGDCRQVVFEANPDCLLLSWAASGKVLSMKASELLPSAFGLESV